MTDKLYQYLKEHWKRNNHKKYQKYFEQWVNNLTEAQIIGFKTIWMK